MRGWSAVQALAVLGYSAARLATYRIRTGAAAGTMTRRARQIASGRLLRRFALDEFQRELDGLPRAGRIGEPRQ